MKFISKTEAYTYCIYVLTQLEQSLIKKSEMKRRIEFVSLAIEDIKVAMENHEQNPRVVIKHLERLMPFLNADMQSLLTELQADLAHNDFKQTSQEKFENILGRRVESELAISLLLNPTQAMMYAVGRVSKEIVKSIQDNRIFINEKNFCNVFTESFCILSFGALKSAPSIDDMIHLLESNDPSKLIEIMYIHHAYGRYLLHSLIICLPPVRKPVGKLNHLIKEIFDGNSEDFFKTIAESKSSKDLRTRFIKELTYKKSPLFEQPTNRGRKNRIQKVETHQLGLMLLTQQDDEIDFPTHDSSWVADCKVQQPNFESQYVIDLIENDTVYVAGPSGMTTTCLGQMELLGNFESEDLKKNYLTAVLSYIAGGGYHSLHEILAPAQYSYDLVPDYHVQVPMKGVLAPPPNYHQFFTQQAFLDQEFETRRQLAWDKYLTYFKTIYGPRHIMGFRTEFIFERPSTKDQQSFFSSSKKKQMSDEDHHAKASLV